MITVRYPNRLRWGLVALLLFVAVNHGEAYVRDRLEARRAAGALNINVEAETGVTGHNSIGIDEKSLNANGGNRFLQFTTLGAWNFKREAPAQCPKPIESLTGRQFSSVGFMYPLEAGDHVKSFCLLRSTQTCCYGPRPQYNQYILVESSKPVSFVRLAPVMVHGTFFVEPRPDDGYIYRMEADSVQAVDQDIPDIDPEKASRQSGIPLFDYVPLAQMGANKSNRTVPQGIKALDGKKVILAGYCVLRTKDTPPRIMVGRFWWDGVAQGQPPTIYNAVVTIPESAEDLPPLYKPYNVFTGTLHVVTDANTWGREGILQLTGARWGAPGYFQHVRLASGKTPVPWAFEFALLLFVFWISVQVNPPAEPTLVSRSEAAREDARKQDAH